MALSFVEYQGDGITKVFAVPFDYISQSDVQVTLDGQPASFTWTSPNTISVTTAPATGKTLKIQRDTEKAAPLVDFQNDSVLDEALLDLMWKQVFMVIQEAQDQADVSYGLSDDAKTIAQEAKGIAQTAEGKADSAIATANGAASTASNAVSTANAATSTANSAVATANNAVSSATAAQNTANSAVTTANSAVTKANEAKSQAASATATANQALSAANNAVTTATDAATLALDAQASAGNAQNAANNAQIAAETAAADAQAAQASAANAEATVMEIRDDVQSITGADFTDFAKNSENLSDLTDKALARTNLGLGNVDNTRDVDKPISSATQTALNGKVDTTTFNTVMSGKANTSHTHSISQVSGLQTALDGKAAASHTHPISQVDGLQAALDGKAADGHTHAITDVTGLQNSLNAANGLAQGVTTQDPNTTGAHVILTNHANSPSASYYWHITTTFYSTISGTANRGQIAVQYNGGNQVYARSCFSGTWTPWVRLDNGALGTAATKDITVSTAAPSGGSDGDIWIQY